ncbi:T9SS type A sorting domain-containing protein [Muricauda sp. DJ-13]|uniref:T9SS type A sorting domain-containing protein n=1 Tax=Croceivirga thetidis TaxID=2721623 RepID=A0ABX1GQ11_9FLAO|nr:T9SS type A sorting domain-containing protein [Croceivirga thetidis]
MDNDGVPNSQDLCNNTPQGEAVNADGCADSELDDDNDGVTNADDLCPNTPSGVEVDFAGCELPPDDDGDGVANEDDICPNTPSGSLVDVNGCEIFTLPASNFTLSSVGISCIGVFDGQINIQAERTLNYSARLRAVSFAESQNFTQNLTFDNLPAGTFELCITVNGVEDFESCSTIVVDAPSSLSVFSEFIEESNLLQLRLEGGNEYEINLNGTSFTTTSNEIELKLSEEENILQISTDKSCQGIFEATYVLKGTVLAYPNPFKNNLTIVRSPASSGEIEIKFYDISGRVLLTDQMDSSNSQKEIDTAFLPQGVYLVQVFENGFVSHLKLIKQ